MFYYYFYLQRIFKYPMKKDPYVSRYTRIFSSSGIVIIVDPTGFEYLSNSKICFMILIEKLLEIPSLGTQELYIDIYIYILVGIGGLESGCGPNMGHFHISCVRIVYFLREYT